MIRKPSHHPAGSAMIMVTLMILLIMIGGVAFLSRSSTFLTLSGLRIDSVGAQYQMEAAYENSKAKLNTALSGIVFNGRLNYVVSSASAESFSYISSNYAVDPSVANAETKWLNFFKDVIKMQAYSAVGVLDQNSPYKNFDTAFPATWTDPDDSDNNYVEARWDFYPLMPYVQTNPDVIRFEYEYRMQVRGYGGDRFSQVSGEDSGVIAITVSGRPFSTWAVFRDRTKNQDGNALYFVGGNTSAQLKDIFTGEVYTGETPYFLGHPVFNKRFSSAVAQSSWVQSENSSYDCCATFNDAKQGGVTPITLPTETFNVVRLAAGDPSNNAATNNTQPTNAEMLNFLKNHATGTISASATAVPNGIYIPVSGSGSTLPTGGVYVEGDAKIKMDVVQGSSDFPAAEWAQIQAGHQSCKFQKLQVDHLSAGIATRDIYIGDEPCNVTYVFNADSPATAPAVLSSRINGNVHASGKIDELGGVSATRPAVAQDFALNISAMKDVRIINHIQYEDAEYVAYNADGTVGDAVVATPTGPVSGSSVTTTSSEIAAVINENSQTVLGIMSSKRNVVVHVNAPANINIHAAIFAGNSAAYNSSTGYGCNANNADQKGCGFGYEGWEMETGKGTIKLLGSISEYRNQTVGLTSSPPKGYSKRYVYDTRLQENVTPPGFPISSAVMATVEVKPFRTWRLSKNDP